MDIVASAKGSPKIFARLKPRPPAARRRPRRPEVSMAPPFIFRIEGDCEDPYDCIEGARLNRERERSGDLLVVLWTKGEARTIGENPDPSDSYK